MRSFTAVVALVLLLVSPLRAAQPPDPVLTEGLRAWTANGMDAALRTWYADRPQLGFEMKEKLLPVTKDLGDVVDTEVVAIQTISKRVTRYYVAIYFTRCPLWLRVERYAGDKQSFFLPLRYSIDPDRILPGYLTEFPQ